MATGQEMKCVNAAIFKKVVISKMGKNFAEKGNSCHLATAADTRMLNVAWGGGAESEIKGGGGSLKHKCLRG